MKKMKNEGFFTDCDEILREFEGYFWTKRKVFQFFYTSTKR
ncbi:MAG: hypothetical protein PT957_04530 [Firmicutes bacterium]|nr:hypothetical protein [Bacillota bacterium]